ncbi:MAG: PAS domain-containing protein [Verrucomicrobiaceae bacterium]|nr:PAS domain-containing protein [Verrucomicrobiaceae bacterium]
MSIREYDEIVLWHREIVDSIHDAVFVHDGTTGRIELVNHRAEEMYGIRSEETDSLTVAQLSVNIPPYTSREALEWLRRACEEGPQLFEWQARDTSNRVFWVEVNLRKAEVMGSVKVLATVRDISQRKQAEEELRRSEEKFRAVLGSAKDPVYCLNLSTLSYEYMSPAVEQVLGFTMEECLEGGLAFFRAHIHPDDLAESQRRLEDFLQGLGEFPPVVEYRFAHKTRGYRWITDSRSIVRDREGHAGAIIGNLRDSTLRKEQEAALEQRAHAALLSHLEGMPLALVECDRHNRVCIWSPQAEKLFGWSADVVIGRHHSEWGFIHPDDAPRAEASLRRLLDRSESRNTCVHRNFTRDGRILVCEWHNSVVLNEEGEIQSVLMLASDITLEKKLEAALRAMAEGVEMRRGETFFQFLCLQLADTLETKFASVAMLIPERDRMVRTLGFCAGGKVQPNVTYSVIDTPCHNVLSGEVCYYDAGLQERFPNDLMLQELGVTCYMGMPLHASDGRVIGLISAFHTQAMDRQERLQAMFQIFAVRAAAELERHQAEMALRRSEERYALAASGSTGGVWDWDIHTGGVYYSPRFRELLGYSPEEFPSLFFSWEQKMHPDDVALVQAALEAHLERRQPFCVEHRLRVKSGEFRWFEARGQALWDEAGAPYRMAGSALDIHERKLDEQRLLRLNRLHAMSSGINEAIVRIQEPQILYDTAVRIAVEKGSMRMAWIGLPDEKSGILRPAACAGHHQGYLDQIVIDVRDDSASGGGPSGRALRSGVHVVSNDISRDHAFYFRERALACGFHSCAAFPLKPDGKTIGVLLIYADERDCFQEEEVRVLCALAENLSFALAAAERERERRQAIEALKENERMISTLMGNLPGMAYRRRVFPSPAMEFVSEGCLDLTGHEAHEIIGGRGPSFDSLIHSEDRDRVLQTIHEAVSSQGHFETTYRIVQPDGAEKWIWERGQAVPPEDGASRHVEGFMTDVTEKRRMESQMLRAQRLESIGTLAGGIAHDLNNILTPILMSLTILRMKLKQPREVELINSLETSANRGADMVKQILGFARGVECSRVLLRPQDVLMEIEQLLHETFPKSILISCEWEAEPWQMEGDPTQLNQVLLNLCVNARDAMPDGGELSISLRNILIDGHFASMNEDARPGRHVVFEVRDTGSGIPPELRDRIFEPFFTTKEFGKGTGLGLATTLGIVRSHHGFIELSSQIGKGSCFRVYFPAAETGKPVERREMPEHRHGRGEVILIVDDEPAILVATSQALEAFGYRTITACDGTDGIAAFLKSPEVPAAVISDMMMPVMDGPTMIQALLKIHPELPVIGASGLNHQMQAKAESLGVRLFLRKPYAADALLGALGDVLDAPSKD